MKYWRLTRHQTMFATLLCQFSWHSSTPELINMNQFKSIFEVCNDWSWTDKDNTLIVEVSFIVHLILLALSACSNKKKCVLLFEI